MYSDNSIKTMEVRVLNPRIAERNNRSLSIFMNYKTSYEECYRFLLGSWLTIEEDLDAPFNKKGIIIIKTLNKIEDCDSIGDMDIVLANSVEEAVNSFYLHLCREDLVLLTDKGKMLLIKTDIKIPSYNLRLNREQNKLKSKIRKTYKKIKETLLLL
ncbi:18 kDa protein [pepper chlorosis associated virus]|nr:18 kDa protein [pepper chlorosis associated virus]